MSGWFRVVVSEAECACDPVERAFPLTHYADTENGAKAKESRGTEHRRG
jgi:hypothetical protein